MRAFVSTSDSTSRFARLTGSNNLGNELHFPPALDLDTNRPFASVDESEVALFLRWLYDPSGVDPTHNVAETPAVMPKTLVEQLQSRPQDWNLIVECSRMDETKRKEELIRAMQSLPPNTLLLISGNKSGTVYDRLSSLIKSMGLEQRVFLLGKVPNADTLEKAYVQTRQQRVWPRTPNLMAVLTGLPFGENERQFRLVVGASASRMEGWGMALHEMMAGGYAIVSSKMVPAATTCNQQYPDAVTIVEEGSNLPSRFADAIKTLIDDPAKARFQSQDTKKFAQDYSWRKLTRRWLRDVDRVFGRQELKRLPIVPGRDHTQITIAEKRHKPLVVVLCGGVGERFKAVTGGEPKQLACVIQPDRSMLQTTVDRLTGVASRDGRFPITPDRVLLVTGQDMVARVASQLPQIPRRNIIAEPMRRNTGPAAALGLHYAQITDPNAPVVIVSADHLITPVDTFLDRIGVAIDVAEQHALMAVFGIDPGRFSAQEGTQYGWIKSGSPLDTAKGVSLVELFKEKPDNNTAQEYLSQGNFLVNSGMFVLGAGLFAKIAHSCQPQMLVALNHYFALVRSGQALPPHAIAEFYRGVSKGPFDIQFVEPTAAAGRVAVVSLGGEFDNVEPSKRVYWSDIGHPEALAKEVIDGRLDPGPEIIGQLQAMQLLPEPANRLSEPVDDDLN
ncbi:MAG: hypothetical protein ACD_62C00255G0001 [uncultured bacterium]|nr:MAG: hypothetical protein ACD_62C00255G0001 [uncultured bacterium]